jgi:hypothetical protein
MDNETKLVLKGYLNLKPHQQKEIAEIIKNHSTYGTIDEQLRKDSNTISMGPVGTGCPCCGR